MSTQDQSSADALPVRRGLASRLEKHRLWAIPVIVIVYAVGFNGQWRISPDSANFARLGRAIAAGEPYVGMLGKTPREHPGLPLLMATNFRLFGEDTLWPAMLAVWLMGLITIWLVYLVMRRRLGTGPAVAVACLCALTMSWYRYSFMLLSDIPFAMGFWLALLGYEYLYQAEGRRLWLGVCLLTAGIAVMAAFRSYALMFVAVFLLVTVLQLIRGPYRRRWAAVLGVAIGAMLLARMADTRLDSPAVALPDENIVITAVTDRLGYTAREAVTERIPKLLTDTLPEAVFGVDLGVPGVPVALLLVVLAAGLLRKDLLWGLLSLALIIERGTLVRSVTRYIIPILPLMAVAWWHFAGWTAERLRRPHGQRVFVALLLLWIVPNAVRVGRVALEQRRCDFYAHYQRGRYAHIHDLADDISKNTPPDAIVLTHSDMGAELSYLSERRVVLPIPRLRRHIRERIGTTPMLALKSKGDELEQSARQLGLRLSDPVATFQTGPDQTWTLHHTAPPRDRGDPDD